MIRFISPALERSPVRLFAVSFPEVPAAAATVTLLCAAIIAPWAHPVAAHGTPLLAGTNTGTFVGPHTWYFQAKPGTFTVDVAAPDSPVREPFSVRVAFAPDAAGDSFTSHFARGSVVVHGTIRTAAKVSITVIPDTIPFVRVARAYALSGGGNIAFAGPGTAR
jgi:hypothetical protein